MKRWITLEEHEGVWQQPDPPKPWRGLVDQLARTGVGWFLLMFAAGRYELGASWALLGLAGLVACGYLETARARAPVALAGTRAGTQLTRAGTRATARSAFAILDVDGETMVTSVTRGAAIEAACLREIRRMVKTTDELHARLHRVDKAVQVLLTGGEVDGR